MRPVPPATPSAAGCAGAAPAAGAGSTADGPRGARPRARAGTRPWIGNTYLDDSGRDSPASLNSTGDM